jgi:predicted phosphodiesterase
MRIAVMSDIHANFEALEAVFQDQEKCYIDAVFCLGDLIGYGPDPDKVVLTIRDRKIDTVMGNHEFAINDPSSLYWFNPSARESLRWTARQLSEESLAFISTLQRFQIVQGCHIVHGFPPNSVTNYAFAVSDRDIRKTFAEMSQRICFIGHTHLLEIIAFDGQKLIRSSLANAIIKLPENQQHIVNVGSVGQPRDGNHDAKYVIYDTDQNTLELRLVSYDIMAVVNKIRAAGLPDTHAVRLL